MAVLKGLVISAAGDLGQGKGNDQLKRWVVNNGGTWIPKVKKGITHLISSKDAYKKNAEPVQQAKRLGAFIVSYDWLDDCLQRRRRLKEGKYTWEVLRTQRRKSKQIKRLAPQADAKKFNDGCELAKQDLGSGTSRKSGGFFSSALDDLRKKREAREAEEKARQAQAAKTPGAQETVSAARGDAVPSALPAKPKPRPAPKSAVSAQETSSPQLEEAAAAPEDASPASPPRSQTSTTPTPTIFPPCLNYTPPSSSSPPLPTPSSTPGPAPALSKPTEPVNPANPKLEDLYHIFLDATGFEYKLLLLRQNPYLNNFARYDLRLYESHTKPHVYCTFVRYVPPAGQSLPVAQAGDKATTNATPLAPAQIIKPEDAPPNHATAEAQRLQALVTPPRPSPVAKFSTLLTPQNSSFEASFRAFRHAFRDITLLSWHERLAAPLQRLRAQAFCIEPFVWRRPAEGLPTGMNPPMQLGEADDVVADGYVRNAFGLPALDQPLGKEGGIGSAIWREAEEARRREEEARKVEAARVNAVKGVKRVRVNYHKPLFNTGGGAPRYYEPKTVERKPSATPTPAPRRNTPLFGTAGAAR